MSWRALGAYITHARRDSALAEQDRRDRNGDYAQLTQVEHMLSVLIDSVRENTYAVAVLDYTYRASHTPKGSPKPTPPKPPTPLERPGVVSRQPRDEIQRTPVGVIGKHIGSHPIPMRDFHRFWADPETYLREQNPEAN